jgi:hypothetical protein
MVIHRLLLCSALGGVHVMEIVVTLLASTLKRMASTSPSLVKEQVAVEA